MQSRGVGYAPGNVRVLVGLGCWFARLYAVFVTGWTLMAVRFGSGGKQTHTSEDWYQHHCRHAETCAVIRTLTWSFCCWASSSELGWSPSLCRVCLWLAAPCRSFPSQECLPLASLSLDVRPVGVLLRWLALLHPPGAPCLCARSSLSAPSWVGEALGIAEPPAGQPAGSWSGVSCGGDPRHKHGLAL